MDSIEEIMTRKSWIISLDALGDRDSEIFESLPGFQRLMREGAYLPHMRGVYPSLTYPSHATILTGRSPDSHRIVNNRRFQPGDQPGEWFWFEKDIQGDTLLRAAKRAGKRVSAFLWPVNAGAKIAGNVAEIFPTRPWHNGNLRVLMNSSPLLALRIQHRFGRLRKGTRQPQLDDFSMEGAHYLLERTNPDLFLLHLLDVDSNKHAYGTKSDQVKEAIRRMDRRVQEILSWREQREDRDNIDLIFLSDHSQIDTPILLFPLSDFEEEGILERKGNRVLRYRFIPQSCGGSCYVYRNPNIPTEEAMQVEEEMRVYLEKYAEETPGIEHVYFSEELRREGSDHKAFAQLEAWRGYAFSDFFRGSPGAAFEKDHHKANHGFHPDKQRYDAVFFALGPDFRVGIREEARNSLLNIAPTIAKVMDLPLKGATGKPILEILQDHVKQKTPPSRGKEGLNTKKNTAYRPSVDIDDLCS